MDPTWPRRKRWFEHVDLVRCEQEQHVGVICQTVHLVEQLEEERIVFPARELAVHGDQVDVFEHDRCWL